MFFYKLIICICPLYPPPVKLQGRGGENYIDISRSIFEMLYLANAQNHHLHRRGLTE